MDTFKLVSDFSPSGDQPIAIDALENNILSGVQNQILMGVTGSGKTFTIAQLIAKLNRPTLIIAHNKTLAAQLCQEFKSFFPDNIVEYFISYYDYYQPEAYIPSRDAYIEKEADINQEIERFRHAATRALFTRRDVIIVASVSCIYGLGLPESYQKSMIQIRVGDIYNRTSFCLDLEKRQYERNDMDLQAGRYRIKGDTIDIFPSWEERILRMEFFGDELDRLFLIHAVTHEILEEIKSFDLFPATHYVVDDNNDVAIEAIKLELKHQYQFFLDHNKSLEAHRIKSRTQYDLEMMSEVGRCKGIENYSRHLSGRAEGEPSGVLIDFFPDDFLTVIDESHVTVPQIRGMYKGDASRKQNLIDYGFRLPSAKDNRPLCFDEFAQKIGDCVYVSATPGDYELALTSKSDLGVISTDWSDYDLVEQLIRPTGLLDPPVDVKSTKNQVIDLLDEIKKTIALNQRVLVTTLTKQMAEDLSDYFQKQSIKVQYLHSDIQSLERLDILNLLRRGTYDVLIGINLLREGLDLPEVGLVAILDADKEGFLRNHRSLIQTMGRAARNKDGRVILYADKMTGSMKSAIEETTRRRQIQMAYNQKNNIVPRTIVKEVLDIRSDFRKVADELEKSTKNVSVKQLPSLIKSLQKKMKGAAQSLDFEMAASIRDEIDRLKNQSD